MIRIRRPIGYVNRKTTDNRVIVLLWAPLGEVPVLDGGMHIGRATIEIKDRTVWADMTLQVRPPSVPILSLDTGRGGMRPHINRQRKIDYAEVHGQVNGVVFSDAPAWPYLSTVPDMMLS